MVFKKRSLKNLFDVYRIIILIKKNYFFRLKFRKSLTTRAKVAMPVHILDFTKALLYTASGLSFAARALLLLLLGVLFGLRPASTGLNGLLLV